MLSLVNKVLGLVILAGLLQGMVINAALAEQGFTYRADIGAGTQSLRQFELPYQVLQGIQRQDYGDLRIVNSQDQNIPFNVTIKKPQFQAHSNEYDLDFFTLPRNPQRRNHLQIDIDRYSQQLSLRAINDQPKYQSFIIIKNQQSDTFLKKIKLHWQPTKDSFSLKVKLEKSNDLEHWQLLKDQNTLYDLQHSAAVLIKDTMYFPIQIKAKYLRLSLYDSNNFVHSVTRITGFFHHQSLPELVNWQVLTLTPGAKTNEWLLHTNSTLPLAKMRFEIPQVGLLYQGELFSKLNSAIVKHPSSSKSRLKNQVKKVLLQSEKTNSRADVRWRYRQGFTQYRLLTKAGEINSNDLSFDGIRNKQWRLLLRQPLMLLPEQIPKINIAWYPVVVTFLAQGDEPYQLVFGNAETKPLAVKLPQQLAAAEPEVVELGEVNTIEPSVVNAQTKKLGFWLKYVDWQTTLLWLVLCSCVLLMVTMAYRLYKGMNQ